MGKQGKRARGFKKTSHDRNALQQPSSEVFEGSKQRYIMIEEDYRRKVILMPNPSW